MDFFTSQHDNQTAHVDDVDSFAKAIANRYENKSLTNNITAKLDQPPSLPEPSPSLSLTMPSPSRKPRSAIATGQEYTRVTPDTLQQHIEDPLTFLVDIRPHAHHVSGRLPGALSLSVPSTLLKRPLFSLDKLAAMIGSTSSQARFHEWRQAKTVLVYDSDTHDLVEGNNVLGLLRKFSNDLSTGEKYTGTIAWLQGGFAAVWKTKRQLVDSNPLEDSPEPDVQPSAPYLKPSNQGSPMKLSRPSSPSASSLSARRKGPGVALSLTGSNPTSSTSSLPASNLSLPPSGFNLNIGSKPGSHSGSSGSGSSGGKNKNNSSLSLAPSNLASQSSGPINPFFDTIRQNTELSQGITERIPLRLSRRVKRRVDELPFDWLKDIARGAGSVDVTDDQSSASSDSTDSENASDNRKGNRTRSFPPSSSSLGARPPSSSGKHRHKEDKDAPKTSPSAIEEGMENLAMQFYRIELAEQRRLMNIMQHHSNESNLSNLSMSKTRTANVLSGEARGSQEGSEDGTGEKAPSFSKNNTETSSASGSSGSGSGSSRTAVFPYSITAGVEKGAKNRYRHIWPFEHARVKIHTKHQRTDSYIEEKRIKAEQNDASNSSQSDVASKPANTVKTAPLGAPLSVAASAGYGGLSAKTPTLETIASGTTAESPSESSESSDAEAGETWTDDYVNASFVQPLCTRKRYIATQGPLEATFNDFWTLVWQQNVHVIVMLTREVEGSMIKCHRYWTDDVKYFEYAAPHTPPALADSTPVPLAPYGPSSTKVHLKLELVSSEGEDRPGGDTRMSYFNSNSTSGFFDVPRDSSSAAAPPKAPTPIIKRVFRLTHQGYKDAPPRTIVHLQYLEWPDMNVPDDPRGVLKLVKEVDKAVALSTYPEEETDDGGAGSVGGSGKGSAKAGSGKASSAKASSGKSSSGKTVRVAGKKHKKILDRENGVTNASMGRDGSPVLLHCSAGVGRTGGFIAIDATLDGIRSELRKNLQKQYYGEDARKDGDGDVVMKNEGASAPSPPRISGVALEAAVVPASSRGQSSRPGPTPIKVERSTSGNSAGGQKTTRTIGIAVSQVGNMVHVPVVPREQPVGDAGLADVAGVREDHDDARNQEQMMVDEQDDQDIRQNADFFEGGKEQTITEDKIKEGLATKRWAENVGDETGANFGTATNPEELGPRGMSVDNTRASSVVPSRPPSGRRRAASTSNSVDVAMSEATEVKSNSLPTRPMPTRDVSMLDITQRTDSPSPFLNSDDSNSRLRTSSSPTPPSLKEFGTPGFIGSSPLANRSKPSLDRNRTVRPHTASQESTASESDNSLNANTRESSLSSGDLLSVANAPPSTIATDQEGTQDGGGLGTLSSQEDSALEDDKKPEYNLPRALHTDRSPELLSRYEEPMWEVVQDMREQRMSLCQSLRQYVFVHAAVVEGALDIADEERSRAARRARRKKNIVGLSSGSSDSNESMLSLTSGSSRNYSASASASTSSSIPKPAKADTPVTSVSSVQTSGINAATNLSSSAKSVGSARKRPPPPKLYLYTSDSSASASGSGQSTGKRVASPTELVREDKSGGVALSKRPSIKRKIESDTGTTSRMPPPNSRSHKRSSSNLAPPPP